MPGSRRLSTRDRIAVRYFASAARLRAWLARNHATASELWVGFHKRHTGTPSITWPGSVDEALCFGWIDGVRRRIDDDRYAIRFTPRRPGSTWSAVNTRRAQALLAAGRMAPAGRRAFAARDARRTERYSHERATAELDAALVRRLRAHRAARAYFERQPPWYRRTATWYVMSAKKPETRERRFASLLEYSARCEWLPQFLRPAPKR